MRRNIKGGTRSPLCTTHQASTLDLSFSLPASPDLAVLALNTCVYLSPSSQFLLSHRPISPTLGPHSLLPSLLLPVHSPSLTLSLSSHSCFYLCPRSSVLRDETRGEVGCGEQRRGRMENPGGREEGQADRLGSLGTSVRAPPRAPRPGPYKQLLASALRTWCLLSSRTSISIPSRGPAGRSTFSSLSPCSQAGSSAQFSAYLSHNSVSLLVSDGQSVGD